MFYGFKSSSMNQLVASVIDLNQSGVLHSLQADWHQTWTQEGSVEKVLTHFSQGSGQIWGRALIYLWVSTLFNLFITDANCDSDLVGVFLPPPSTSSSVSTLSYIVCLFPLTYEMNVWQLLQEKWWCILRFLRLFRINSIDARSTEQQQENI